MEKQKAEEEQRKMQEAQDRENDMKKDEGNEPTMDQLSVQHESELDQVVEGKDEVPSEQAENLGSSEMTTLPQKNVIEGSEKVTSSREKREFRRQRGLEHNELQNKHVQFSFEEAALLRPEEQTSSEEGLENVPEPKESTEQVAVLQKSNEKEQNANRGKAISDTPLLSEIKEEYIPEQLPALEVERVDKAVDRVMKIQESQNSQLKVSQSCPERPTNLALNLENTLFAPGSFQTPAECWGDKNKRPVQKETKDLDSPTSSQIQRYVDDPGKLKYKREKWKGKRQSDAGQNDMLSQSLDGRTRADQSPQDPLE